MPVSFVPLAEAFDLLGMAAALSYMHGHLSGAEMLSVWLLLWLLMSA